MRCYGLTLPGSDNRFFIPTLTPSLSFKPKPITRISFGSKLKATFNDGVVADQLSFYDLLGIPESGSLMDIKSAYKQLARKYHPDVSPPGRVEEYTKRFIQVQEAYETLSDPSRRIMYDRDMARGIHLAFNARKRYNHSDQVSIFPPFFNLFCKNLIFCVFLFSLFMIFVFYCLFFVLEFVGCFVLV
jgi:hypothetical protein